MLYLLYGTDSYRREERVREMRQAYRGKNPLALGETILESPDDFSSVEDAFAQGGGLFEEKRFLILRDVFSRYAEKLLALFQRTDTKERKDMVVVLVEGDIASHEHFSELRTLCRADAFMPLSAARLRRWIEAYIEKEASSQSPKRVSAKALALLATLGSDLWRLSHELEKLLAFSAGRETLEEVDVREMVVLPQEAAIFPIGDGMAERKPFEALVATERFVAKGEAIEGLIGYVLREVQNLVRAHAALENGKTTGGEKLFGIHPFVWKKRVSQAKRWNEEKIGSLLEGAVQLDIGWKSGRDKRLALDSFLLASAEEKR